MGEFNLNLSTRPFPAYRVANVGLILFFLLVAGVSAWQAYSFRFYSERAVSIRAENLSTQAAKKGLAQNLDTLSTSLDRPITTAKLTEIDFLNNLIVHKHFSWTQVFANLEGVIPDNVHLVSVAPEITKDKVKLSLATVCRSISDESEFIRRLQASPVFQDVVVTHEEQKDSKDATAPANPLGNAFGNTAVNRGAAVVPSSGGNDVQVTMSVSYYPERAPK